MLDVQAHRAVAVYAERRERDAAPLEVLAAERHELLALAERAVHLDARARRAAEDARDRGVGGIAAGANPHQAVQVRQSRRVEHDPAAADEALEAGVEVRRLELIGVAGEIARRNVQRAAQRDAEMREVAAHAGALRDGVVGRGHRVGAAAQVLDVLVNPVG